MIRWPPPSFGTAFSAAWMVRNAFAQEAPSEFVAELGDEKGGAAVLGNGGICLHVVGESHYPTQSQGEEQNRVIPW